MKSIPCTVAILTHNSGATLPRALESVQNFAEILVCDGNSTDNTATLARAFGARVIQQDKTFLDAVGRIKDFSGVRNQTLHAATQPWFLYIDSDEYIGSELVKEIERIVATASSGAYFVPRLYVLDEEIIRCASTYPSRQMRFFHRSAVRQFIKSIHERIEMIDGVVPSYLSHPMYVPLSSDAGELRRKWSYYLALEDLRRPTLSFRAWISFSIHEALVGILYTLRYIRGVIWCPGKRLPFTLEAARIWYQYEVIRRSIRAVRGW